MSWEPIANATAIKEIITARRLSFFRRVAFTASKSCLAVNLASRSRSDVLPIDDLLKTICFLCFYVPREFTKLFVPFLIALAHEPVAVSRRSTVGSAYEAPYSR